MLSQWVKRGESCRLHGSLFGRDHAIKGSVCLIWEVNQPEAWCLFTNVPHMSGTRYALRWWQEESFKDLKSGGWQWQDTRLRCPRRMERLLLVMAIAYGWMVSCGVTLHQLPSARQRAIVDDDELQRLSLFRLGLRWFHYQLQTAQQALRVAL